jgi:hypothetical protein
MVASVTGGADWRKSSVARFFWSGYADRSAATHDVSPFFVAGESRYLPGVAELVSHRNTQESPARGVVLWLRYTPQQGVPTMKRRKNLIVDDRLTGQGGCVFSVDGRIAGAMPPIAMPGAILFRIGVRWKGDTRMPEWQDVTIGTDDAHTKALRMNPALVHNSMRLYDCVSLAWRHWGEFKSMPEFTVMDLPPKPHPNSVQVAFALARIDGRQVLMIDTLERIRQHERT